MADERLLADVGRMYREACSRIDDADFLARHVPASRNNSDHLLRVLGLEVLLKAGLKLFGVAYATSGGQGHHYAAHWNCLPGDARREVLDIACERMRGVGGEDYEALDLSNGKNVVRTLNQAEYFFTQARYQYEDSEGLTRDEQRAVEDRWIERGARSDEAAIVTRALEIDALIIGLRTLIKARLPPQE